MTIRKNHIITFREIPGFSQCVNKVLELHHTGPFLSKSFFCRQKIFLKKKCYKHFKFIYFQIMSSISATVPKYSLITSASSRNILLGVKISEITCTCWSNLSYCCPLNTFYCWVRHYGIWFIFTGTALWNEVCLLPLTIIFC